MRCSIGSVGGWGCGEIYSSPQAGFYSLKDYNHHGRTQPKITGGGGGSEVQKGTLLLLLIWHRKKGTCPQKGHFHGRAWYGMNMSSTLKPLSAIVSSPGSHMLGRLSKTHMDVLIDILNHSI